MATIDLVIDSTKAETGAGRVNTALDGLMDKATALDLKLKSFQLQYSDRDLKNLKSSLPKISIPLEFDQSRLAGDLNLLQERINQRTGVKPLKIYAELKVKRLAGDLALIQRQIRERGPLTVKVIAEYDGSMAAKVAAQSKAQMDKLTAATPAGKRGRSALFKPTGKGQPLDGVYAMEDPDAYRAYVNRSQRPRDARGRFMSRDAAAAIADQQAKKAYYEDIIKQAQMREAERRTYSQKYTSAREANRPEQPNWWDKPQPPGLSQAQKGQERIRAHWGTIDPDPDLLSQTSAWKMAESEMAAEKAITQARQSAAQKTVEAEFTSGQLRLAESRKASAERIAIAEREANSLQAINQRRIDMSTADKDSFASSHRQIYQDQGPDAAWQADEKAILAQRATAKATAKREEASRKRFQAGWAADESSWLFSEEDWAGSLPSKKGAESGWSGDWARRQENQAQIDKDWGQHDAQLHTQTAMNEMEKALAGSDKKQATLWERIWGRFKPPAEVKKEALDFSELHSQYVDAPSKKTWKTSTREREQGLLPEYDRDVPWDEPEIKITPKMSQAEKDFVTAGNRFDGAVKNFVQTVAEDEKKADTVMKKLYRSIFGSGPEVKEAAREAERAMHAYQQQISKNLDNEQIKKGQEKLDADKARHPELFKQMTRLGTPETEAEAAKKLNQNMKPLTGQTKKLTDQTKEQTKATKDSSRAWGGWIFRASVVMSGIASTIFVGKQLTAWMKSFIRTGTEFGSTLIRMGSLMGETTTGTENLANSVKYLMANTGFQDSTITDAFQALVDNGATVDEAYAKVNQTMEIARGGGLKVADAAKIAINDVFGLAAAYEQANARLEKTASSSMTKVHNKFKLVAIEFYEKNEINIVKAFEDLGEWIDINRPMLIDFIESIGGAMAGVIKVSGWFAKNTYGKMYQGDLSQNPRNRAQDLIRRGLMSQEIADSFRSDSMPGEPEGRGSAAWMEWYHSTPDTDSSVIGSRSAPSHTWHYDEKGLEDYMDRAEADPLRAQQRVIEQRLDAAYAKFGGGSEGRKLAHQSKEVKELAEQWIKLEKAILAADAALKAKDASAIARDLQDVFAKTGIMTPHLDRYQTGQIEDRQKSLERTAELPGFEYLRELIPLWREVENYLQEQAQLKPLMEGQKASLDAFGRVDTGPGAFDYWENEKKRMVHEIEMTRGISEEERQRRIKMVEGAVQSQIDAPYIAEHQKIFEATGDRSSFLRIMEENEIGTNAQRMSGLNIDPAAIGRYERIEQINLGAKDTAAEHERQRGYFDSSGIASERLKELDREELERARKIAFISAEALLPDDQTAEIQRALDKYETGLADLNVKYTEPALREWSMYFDATGKMSDEYYQVREQRIEASADIMKRILGDEVAATAYANKEKLALDIDYLNQTQEHWQGLKDGMRSGHMQMQLDARTTAEKVSSTWVSTVNNLDAAFKDGFFELIEGRWNSMVDVAESAMRMMQRAVSDIMAEMAKDWIREVAKMVLPEAVKKFFATNPFSNTNSGIDPGFGGGGTDGEFASGTIWAERRHRGGIVGSGSAPMISVPSSLFSHAPRLHNGLRTGEFPAILERGEEVIAKNQVGKGGNVTVNVINNNPGAQISERRRETPHGPEIDILIDAAVAQKLSQRGSASNKTLRSTYGAKESLVTR